MSSVRVEYLTGGHKEWELANSNEASIEYYYITFLVMFKKIYIFIMNKYNSK